VLTNFPYHLSCQLPRCVRFLTFQPAGRYSSTLFLLVCFHYRIWFAISFIHCLFGPASRRTFNLGGLAWVQLINSALRWPEACSGYDSAPMANCTQHFEGIYRQSQLVGRSVSVSKALASFGHLVGGGRKASEVCSCSEHLGKRQAAGSERVFSVLVSLSLTLMSRHHPESTFCFIFHFHWGAMVGGVNSF
jgi:hypothetical protein